MKFCLSLLLAFSFTAVFADQQGKTPSGTAQAPADLNAILAKRADTCNEIFRLQRSIDRSWSDSKIVTEKISALRKRYRELLEETDRVRREIRAEVARLPQIKAKQEQISLLEKQVSDLDARAKKLSAEKEE